MRKVLLGVVILTFATVPTIAGEKPPRGCFGVINPAYPDQAYRTKWLRYCLDHDNAEKLYREQEAAERDAAAAHATEDIDRELEFDDWCIRMNVDCTR